MPVLYLCTIVMSSCKKKITHSKYIVLGLVVCDHGNCKMLVDCKIKIGQTIWTQQNHAITFGTVSQFSSISLLT